VRKWNDCYFEGSAGKDSTQRVLQNGKTLTQFSFAVFQGKEKPPMWLQCKIFNECAVILKGQKVCVKGHLYFEEYNDRDGNLRSAWGVVADEITVLERNTTSEEMF
jgi:single-stranded DNA-binding protein